MDALPLDRIEGLIHNYRKRQQGIGIDDKLGLTKYSELRVFKLLNGDHLIIFFIAMICLMIVLFCDALGFNSNPTKTIINVFCLITQVFFKEWYTSYKFFKDM